MLTALHLYPLGMQVLMHSLCLRGRPLCCTSSHPLHLRRPCGDPLAPHQSSVPRLLFSPLLPPGRDLQATDRLTGTTMALKLYDMDRLGDLNRHQVYREVRLHMSLDHRHVLRLLAAFQEGHQVTALGAGGGQALPWGRRGGCCRPLALCCADESGC